MDIRVKIKKLREGFELPEKQLEAACYDVKVCFIENKGDIVTCYLGFATEIPKGVKGVIVPRSMQTKTKWAMLNSPGQVDEDYRGEWQIKFTYIGQDIMPRINDVVIGSALNTPWNKNSSGEIVREFPFKVGDRVAQIYFEPVYQTTFLVCENLKVTERGSGGFGSTGK